MAKTSTKKKVAAQGDKSRARRQPPAPRKATKKRKSSPNWLLATALSALSGGLVFLSFPPWDLFFLEWFALLPLLWVLEGRSAKGALWYGWVAGLATNLGGFHWIDPLLRDFGHLPAEAAVPITVLLAGYQGLVFMLWAWLFVWLRGRTRFGAFALAPAAFAGVEFLFPLIFPWYLGNGQYKFYAATQIAEWTGVLGITFVVVLANVALFELLRGLVSKKARVPVLAVTLALAVVAADIVYGFIRIDQIDEAVAQADKIKIGMVESNVGIWENERRSIPEGRSEGSYLRQLLLRHHRMSAELELQGAELIVWPESSYFPVPSNDVWTKKSDLFALTVGDAGTLLQKRGSEWFGASENERYPFPPSELSRHALTAIWVDSLSENNAFVVGEGGVVLHFNGETWTQEETGVDSTLRDVVGTRGGTFVAAVGDEGTVLMRGHEGKWNQASLGDSLSPALTSVAAASDGSLYVIDAQGGTVRCRDGDCAALPPLDGRVRAGATAANGLTNAGLWVVGDNGLAAVYTRDGWTKTQTNRSQTLRAVLAVSRDEVYAAGDGGTLLRWDGKRWHGIRHRYRSTTLRGLASDPLGGVIAVGDGGFALRYHDGQVEPLDIPTNAHLRDVAAVGFLPYYPIPRDVAWFRPTQAGLPSEDDEAAAETADADTPSKDRNAVIRGFRTPIIFGGITGVPAYDAEDGERAVYNAALFLGPDGKVLGNYEKNFLLVFGEYIPFEWDVSKEMRDKLRTLIPEGEHFRPGTKLETFPFRGYEVGVIICYEGIIPSYTRKLTGKDPNLLVNLVNDAWFGKTSEPYLHLALATFRSIENRLALVRSTNTGVSALVDPVGRIVQQTSIEHAEALLQDVPMMEIRTFYRRYGDIFAYVCLLWLGLLVVFGVRKRKQKKRTS